MAAPVVQSIEQIIQDLNPAYQPLIGTIQAKQAQIPGMFNAQRMGLDAQKVQGFNQINNQATGRGMSFSGMPADEQANYLSTKYLPGMQQLAQQENDQNLAMTEALAKIDQERRLRSMDIRTDQSKRLESYLSEQRQMEWDRQKFAQQQSLERAKMASDNANAAANRAAQAGPAGVSSGTMGAIQAQLQKSRGKDGFVSPGAYTAMKQKWMQEGGNPAAFNDAYGNYVNPYHQKKFGGYF